MIEEQYLVYQCYGITQGEKEEDIIIELRVRHIWISAEGYLFRERFLWNNVV